MRNSRRIREYRNLDHWFTSGVIGTVEHIQNMAKDRNHMWRPRYGNKPAEFIELGPHFHKTWSDFQHKIFQNHYISSNNKVCKILALLNACWESCTIDFTSEVLKTCESLTMFCENVYLVVI